jgi:hypothetical protein
LASPRIRTTETKRSAPVTPDTTAKMVMTPSFAPYTASGR